MNCRSGSFVIGDHRIASGVACLDCSVSKSARHHHSREGCGSQQGQPLLPPDFVATDEIVEADAQHSCDELEQSEASDFGIAAKVVGTLADLFGRVVGEWAAPGQANVTNFLNRVAEVGDALVESITRKK
jgi:hypothetical protein